MQPVVIAIVAAVIGIALGYAFNRFLMKDRTARSAEEAERLVGDATKQAETMKREALVEAKDQIFQMKQEAETDVKERRKEIQALEQRLAQREESVDRRAESVDKREHQLSSQQGQVAKREQEVEELIEQERQRLEAVAGMTAEDARAELMVRIQDDVKRDAAAFIRETETRAREEADKKARNIVGIAIQRVAADHTAESTVSVVHIPSDDMKGRIIGREGRNIRAFEQMTGINLIIDDTPEAVILSSFDPVRREIGRITLETLIADGRIHPARIEEMVNKAETLVDAADPRGRRAGRVRCRRAQPASRDRPHARPPEVPHHLRPERAQALARGLVARRRHGERARRRPDAGQAGRSPARPRQGHRPRGRRPPRRRSAPTSPGV